MSKTPTGARPFNFQRNGRFSRSEFPRLPNDWPNWSQFGPLARPFRFFLPFVYIFLYTTLVLFTSRSFYPKTTRNLPTSLDHPPKPQLHPPPRSIPERCRIQRDLPCQLSQTTPLYPFPDFRWDYTTGLPPVDESRKRAIGTFISIYGLSALFALPYSDQGRLS